MEEVLYSIGCRNLAFTAFPLEACVHQTRRNSKGHTVVVKDAEALSSTDDLTQNTNLLKWFQSSLSPKEGLKNRLDDVTGTLRLLMSSWPQKNDRASIRKVLRLGEQSFHTVMKEMSLCNSYPFHYSTAVYAATAFNAKNLLKQNQAPLTAIFQTPTRTESFFSLALSYDPIDDTTNAILTSMESPHASALMDRIEAAKDHVTHPLALPILLYLAYIDIFRELNDKLLDGIRQIQTSTGVMDRTWLTRHSARVSANFDYGALHQKLITLQDRTTGSQQGSLEDFGEQISKCFEILDDIEEPKFDQKAHTALKSVFYNLSRNASVERRTAQRYELKLECQHKVLYFLMQQKDSRVNHALAVDSKKIAEASKRDSSSMKAIASLTMVFLPGTAVATIFSMSQFFVAKDGTLYASSTFWIFWAVTIPLTILVMTTWLIWTWLTRRRRDERLQQIEFDSGTFGMQITK